MNDGPDDRDGTTAGDGDATADLAAVLDRARARVDPDPDERRQLQAVVETVLDRAREAVAGLTADGLTLDGETVRATDIDHDAVDVLQVGSTARDTWVSGDRDVDVFVRFPTTIDRERLERYGLAIGRAVLPDGEAAYAEHPYVTGTVDGVDVDLVPCYAVTDAAAIRSAVDRTPFHTRYLATRLTDRLAGAVRLAKGFLTGIGVYGSDLRTRGFSGYLTELLVIAYDGFEPFVRAAAEWRPPVDLDPEGHAARSFDDPLVVVDPTDPERNVAAVVSETNVARTIHHARSLLARPSLAAFVPDRPAPLSPAAVRAHLDRRGTAPVAVRFTAPDLVDDQLYPQLRRSLSGLTDALDRHGFAPLRGRAMAADRDPTAPIERPAALFVECELAERPRIERHEGPPVAVAEHARRFYETYVDAHDAVAADADADAADETGVDPDPVTVAPDEPVDDPTVSTDTAGPYGPFLDGQRYVVERDREYTTARALLEEGLLDVALGAQLADVLADGYEVLTGAAVADLAERDAFARELAAYFAPRP